LIIMANNSWHCAVITPELTFLRTGTCCHDSISPICLQLFSSICKSNILCLIIIINYQW
jgi:hypothetical protein